MKGVRFGRLDVHSRPQLRSAEGELAPCVAHVAEYNERVTAGYSWPWAVSSRVWHAMVEEYGDDFNGKELYG